MKKSFIYFLFLVFSLYSCTTNENTTHSSNTSSSNTNDNSVTNNSQSGSSNEVLNQNIKLRTQASNTTRTRFDTRSRAS